MVVHVNVQAMHVRLEGASLRVERRRFWGACGVLGKGAGVANGRDQWRILLRSG